MILLTGATGFLGKRVAKKLEARGLVFHPTSLSMGTDRGISLPFKSYLKK